MSVLWRLTAQHTGLVMEGMQGMPTRAIFQGIFLQENSRAGKFLANTP